MIRALTNADAEVYSKIEYAILTEYQRIEIKHIWQAAWKNKTANVHLH